MAPKGSPKRVAKSPIKASPKPMTPSRTSSRTVNTPSRLGIDDSWGTGAARAWVSTPKDAATPSKASSAAAKKAGPALVGAADLAMLGGGIALFYHFISLIKCKSLMGSPTVSTFAGVTLAVVLPQLFYVFVWFKPATFKKWCSKGFLKVLGKKPVATFEKFVLLGKIVQEVALLMWAFYLTQRITSVGKALDAVAALPLNQKLCAAALIIAGQALNVSVYKAIGKDGVYYGFKLGAKVPWSTAFPFSAGFRHPQYVGGYVTQLGVMLALANTATLDMGLLPLTVLWFLLYLVNALVEATGDADA